MIDYKISSFCSMGSCVEVGRTPDGHVAVRDSKNRDQAPMIFSVGEWDAFIAGAKNAEFDLS